VEVQAAAAHPPNAELKGEPEPKKKEGQEACQMEGTGEEEEEEEQDEAHQITRTSCTRFSDWTWVQA
jgi:hypothetical protein